MPIADHPPVQPVHRTNTQSGLRLTREEVRVLQYYRTLSDTDREAARCLLQALQAVQAELAHRPVKANPAMPGRAKPTPPIRL
ncbi:hypothetical protein [Pseudomonas fluorescens]|uniref:hypothetical protein n=1 Tax=Pseudomonas fluorescens TaxID=294 RepID=UPI0009360C3A|nr:hypothetical protein [Pseudomonas fluorescens]